MNQIISVIIFCIVIFVFGFANYYIGKRNWQLLKEVNLKISKKIYWIIFWIISMSYVSARLFGNVLPKNIRSYLTIVGSYWLAVMIYSLMLLGLLELVKFINHRFRIINVSISQEQTILKISKEIILFIVIGILVFGTWNARNPVVKKYEITVPKKAGDIKEINIVMVSDIHLGTIINNGRLTKMVEGINGLKPDVVLFVGDIIDEDVDAFVDGNMVENFKKIKSTMGVYAVPGNHEHISGHMDELYNYLRCSGVNVLIDNYIKIQDDFYVIGREDISGEKFDGIKRKELPQLLQGIDKSLPMILLDHQPYKFNDVQSAGIDLQFSGHTHKGQLFPVNLVTDKMFETDWGYTKKGSSNFIVSSGYGTWGPPIRIGSRSEIVNVRLKFSK